MNNKDKFLMFLSLICLPFGELAAEQIGNMEVFPINQEIQQNVKITGRVIDAGGEAIIGASIVEKGTTNGTIRILMEIHFECKDECKVGCIVCRICYSRSYGNP